MLVIVLLAATLNLWNLSASGYGNLYYAAAVRSMAQSWHNFFYASYDPGGFVTVDKPPLGFWAQVVSVKLLGFSGFSLVLPEALAGILAVVALWRVTRRTFGPAAGVLAALALAISPINVVANRDNILEPLLTLTLLLAAWAACVAAERGQLRWLLVSAALLGLGFNIKMLEAYLIVPAVALVYLIGAPGGWRTRARHLALAGVVMIALSFAWIAAVDMTPASQRPYVGSTVTNSELELALSYNGAGRLLGGLTLPFAHQLPGPLHHVAHFPAPRDFPTHVGGYPHAVPPQTQTNTHPLQRARALLAEPVGAPGPWRLFQAPLGSQVSWLLPLALIGFALTAGAALLSLLTSAPREVEDGAVLGRRARVMALRRRWASWRREARSQGLLLWGGWLFTGALVFSFAHSINAYYVAVLAPAICALAGISAVELWRWYCAPARGRVGRWLGLLLPLALLGAAQEQTVLLSMAPGWKPWLAQAVRAGALALALLLCALWLGAQLRTQLRAWIPRHVREQASSRGVRWASPFKTALASLALVATLAAPTTWTLGSLTWGNAGGWPSAGPQFASVGPPKAPMVDAAMMRYLLAHRGEDRFIVGALNAYITAPIIVATGQPVLDMGGFTGADPILTQHLLAQLVANDQVHLFLLPSTNVTSAQRALLFPAPAMRGAARLGSGATSTTSALSVGTTSYTNALTRWVSSHCAPVPPHQWSSASYATHRLGAWELFACQS